MSIPGWARTTIEIRRKIVVLLVLVSLVAGCRAHVLTAPVPLPSQWEHCWWTVVRSTLPADSVASQYRRAFISVGMTGVHWTKSGDTIWVRAGPVPLLPGELPYDTATYGATYWSRVVAFRRGDSTHFRLYTAVTPPPRGWGHFADSSRVTTWRHFAACEAIANAAEVRWLRRLGDPGDEETLPVWSRVP